MSGPPSLPDACPHSLPTLAAYIVALDHEYEAIVLALRGTHSVTDILTDAAAGNVPFLSGLAHSGMAQAAGALMGDAASLGTTSASTAADQPDSSGAPRLLGLARLLGDLVSKHPSYRVVVVGHSLGGGVAALLTMRLFHSLSFAPEACQRCGFGIGAPLSPPPPTPPSPAAAESDFVKVRRQPLGSHDDAAAPSRWRLQPYPLHCFAFGCPPVASQQVVSFFQPHITTTVMGADFVPRVSLHMVRRLRSEVHASRSAWWQDLIVDVRASAVGQATATAVEHVASGLGAARDVSSALLGRLVESLRGSAHEASTAGDEAAAVAAEEAQGGDVAEDDDAGVYVQIARDLIHRRPPGAPQPAASAEDVLVLGVQQHQPEAILSSSDTDLVAVHQRATSHGSSLSGELAKGYAEASASLAGVGATNVRIRTPTTTQLTPKSSTARPTVGEALTLAASETEEELVLLLPGNILHLTPVDATHVKYGYEARLVPPSHFHTLAFTPDMWQHHKRRLYGRALSWLAGHGTDHPSVVVGQAAASTALPSPGAVSQATPQPVKVQVPISAIPHDAASWVASITGHQPGGPALPAAQSESLDGEEGASFASGDNSPAWEGGLH